MKRFWLGVIRSLVIRAVVLTVVITVFHLWNFWAVPWAFALAILSVAVRGSVEYWAINREANKFQENLEFFARVYYDSGWNLMRIQMHPDDFRRELEKRKLTWMRDKK